MKSKKKNLVVANWKANPDSLRLAKDIFSQIKKQAVKNHNVETVMCPPVIYLESLKSLVSGNSFVLGAQDFFYEPSGSFTGYVGFEAMLDTKIKYAIIGHSERRGLGENNETINKKILAALSNSITPILCVGEIRRDANLEYLNFIKQQIVDGFYKVPKSKVQSVVIAYEPVWAIGKEAKRDVHPREVEEISIFIKRVIGDLYKTKSVPPIKIIYGGSVTPNNAEHLLEKGAIDGLLVGRASLNPKSFSEILSIANKTNQ